MTDALLFVHQVGARALVAFAVVLGVWGAYLYFRRESLTGGFRSSFLIMTKRREAVYLAGAAWIVAIAYLRGFATG